MVIKRQIGWNPKPRTFASKLLCENQLDKDTTESFMTTEHTL